MKSISCFCALFLLLGLPGLVSAVEGPPPDPTVVWNWGLSLHKNRQGKEFWYSAENGGFESFTNVPIEDLGCAGCHGPVNANGLPYPEPYDATCLDCHPTNDYMNVQESQCYGCHGRQKMEAQTLGYTDVHRSAGMVCWDCHWSSDMHGDGLEHDSMLEPGAIYIECWFCHEDLPAEHADYDPHAGKLHCSACHTRSVISCYNCHFESQVDSHVKRAKQPIHDFVLLVNREKDGKVGTASFQSLSYQGSAFTAFGPYSGHTTVLEGRTCTECHVNEPIGGTNAAIEEYNQTGQLQFAEWDDVGKVLSWKHGVVPMPYDYTTSFRMDFITYDGATSDPPAPSSNWSSIGKDTWDGHQMFFATPLSADQMVSLGMGAETTLAQSLHGTRAGKAFWYDAANGGIEAYINVPIEDVGCLDCHGPTDADGNPYPDPFPGASCVDCHPTNDFMNVSESQCYGCHGRQKTEAVQLNLPDVHRSAGMKCWDCHTKGDLHGDGTSYVSMLEPGAIDVDCEDCHDALPASHDAYDPHGGKIHCASCHASTVISCYNCHYESQVDSHVKRAKQPLSDFVMLVNREKDGKVYPASFQSVTYEGTAFVAFGPFSPHTIRLEGRTCADCHANQPFGGTIPAIDAYNSTGEIKFASWDDTGKTLSWLRGVVPIPENYETTLKMDFITYDGATSDPPGPSSNWSPIGKDTWDGHQMFFATPLTYDQMVALGMGAEDLLSQSLHGTRYGKEYWYGTANNGFETFTNVPIEDLGCRECHGPADADGNPYDASYQPGCVDCHPTNDWFNVSQNQCYGCHGRQKTEAMQLGLSDVHRDAGMQCWDCHTSGDLHGDGTAYQSMFEPGAIDASCEDCHPAPSAEHDAYDPHSGKLHCSACHAQTVISCYNCHFESQVDSHVKRAKQPISGFVLLVNRDVDGKVGTASFQSLSYQGDAYVAFGPYTPHAITVQGRTCTECHVNFPGGANEAIEQYNAEGFIQFAAWDDVAKTLTWKHGAVPMPQDYESAFRMDFITYDGATSDPPGPSTNWSSIGKNTWDGHQMFFATPLDYDQMASLGFQTGAPILGVGDGLQPVRLTLAPASPSPFTSSTRIAYVLPAEEKVNLALFDVRGRKVRTLVDTIQSGGEYSVIWDGLTEGGVRAPAGLYFMRLDTGHDTRVQKVLLAR